MPRVRGPQEFTLPEGATLKQLVEKGLSMSHAGVGTVVRLRKELSLVKDVPVLIAIDDVSSLNRIMTEFQALLSHLHVSSLLYCPSSLKQTDEATKFQRQTFQAFCEVLTNVLLLSGFSVQQLVRLQ